MAPFWTLFETTESVIEILWDIALAVFILRLAVIYAFLAFTLSALLSYLSYNDFLRLAAHLPAAVAVRAEWGVLALHILLATACARFLVTYNEIPRVAGFRLAIGALGTVFVAGADLLTAGVLYEAGEAGVITHCRGDAGAVLVALALAPLLLMQCEGHPSELHDAAHGRERESFVDAVPTVDVTVKKGQDEKKSS